MRSSTICALLVLFLLAAHATFRVHFLPAFVPAVGLDFGQHRVELSISDIQHQLDGAYYEDPNTTRGAYFMEAVRIPLDGDRLRSMGVVTLEADGKDDEAEFSRYRPLIPKWFCHVHHRKWFKTYGHFGEFTKLCDSFAYAESNFSVEFQKEATFRTVGKSEARTGMVVGNAIVTKEGRIIVESGASIQDGQMCYGKSKLALSKHNANCTWGSTTCILTVEDDVVVASGIFGSERAHFFKEFLPKLSPFLDKLYKHQHIKVQIKTKHSRRPDGFINKTFELLGIDPSRLIYGDVGAKRAWFSLPSTCGMVVDQFWRLKRIRDALIAGAGSHDSQNQGSVIVLERRNTAQRFWSDPQGYEELFDAVRKGVPRNIPVIRFSDRNETLMGCLECQINLFRNALAAIGVHGAGLSNTMYMNPGTLVAEIMQTSIQNGEYMMNAHAFGQKYYMHPKHLVDKFNFTRITIVLQYYFKGL